MPTPDRNPELDAITIEGFKSIGSIQELKLGPINVLIGANGSGKSNFIGAFSFLHAIREGHLQDYVVKAGGADKILHHGSKETQKIKIWISFEGGVNQYKLSLEPSASDELIPTEEYAYSWDKASYTSPFETKLQRGGKEAGISGSQSSQLIEYVQHHLNSWRIYHFHDTSPTSPMKKTADVNDNRYFRPDGANLAPFLYYLREKEGDSYNLICGAIQRVAPYFSDFVLEPQKLNSDKMRLEWKHKNSESYFDVSSLSDGTLRFIALATLFLQPQKHRPPVILVDEPEIGLHPYAITMISSLIKQASRGSQVIIATQSSLLLDHFEPEDVLVAERSLSGTTLTRLDPQKLEAWLEDYSLGQLWEKNELGGRPGEGQ